MNIFRRHTRALGGRTIDLLTSGFVILLLDCWLETKTYKFSVGAVSEKKPLTVKKHLTKEDFF